MLQTWLPLPDFHQSARALSDEDLTMQRVHILELLEAFHDVEESEIPDVYPKHDIDEDSPIWRMWKGYEVQLAEYGLTCCDELGGRQGFADNLYEKIRFHQEAAISDDSDLAKPNWFGDVDVHISHQVALVKANPDHYAQHFKVMDWEQSIYWPESNHA